MRKTSKEMFSRLTMLLLFKRTVKEEYTRMRIEDCYGRAVVSQVSSKSFGKESASLCSLSIGTTKNHMPKILVKA